MLPFVCGLIDSAITVVVLMTLNSLSGSSKHLLKKIELAIELEN